MSVWFAGLDIIVLVSQDLMLSKNAKLVLYVDLVLLLKQLVMLLFLYL
jgi:hypothetical protein